ncbi:PREDICTED: centromere/kinetochore protein zw10 homolog [Nicotiana attenuata]|uniref:Centromerekinetochore protein zw10-like protein n=1 Tax=Nicotiana attenuata TaxID=49451 RepID=A0A1J6ISB4_NICAT|nr:PREDICTED: centromere/kinetochore protein zw10 homolog [Nicotiana attenuata]OIT03456.1 centromerekinetochore protein zw10-like protein [Nicotiana attenuata]
MDVLFNSIDVRDLLSSPDIDDVTSPLSAPDLRLLMDRLQVRSIDIKSKVRQYILSHYSDFSTLFSQCSDVVSRSEHLSSEVSNLIQLISDHPVEVETKAVIDDIVIRNRELKEKRELLGLLAVILELSDKLRFVKEEIKVGRVEQAAEALRELKAVLVTSSDKSTAFEERQPLVYGLLKDEWTECFEEMQEVLLRCMDNAVWFEQENNTVHLKHQSNIKGIDGIELQIVLKAMDAVGIMDYGLAKVADLMIKHVIAPVVSFRSTIVVEETNQESGNGAEANLKILPSADPNVDSMDGGSMYSVLVDIVKFISKSLCFGNSTWMLCFGRLTWPRMSDLIISNFLSKNVPDDASKLADFQKIIKCTSDFEESLKELMFIASSDGKDDRLSKFADNVEVHFASRKKVEILAKARNLLLHSDFRLPEDGTRRRSKVKYDKKAESSCDLVIDLLFTSERCVVSEAASGLMKLVHGTLKDVCLSSPRVGLEFYHAARDSLLLYEAVIPVKFERQLDSINHSAVLIHNDCHYLSQEILGLAFEYRSDFPASIKELVVFADLAPRFQLLAEEVLRRQIKLVIYNLKQAIDGADGFQNTHQMKQYESAKLSIDQVIFILEKVYIIWHHLLLPSAYKRSMSMVLEAVFSRIANDILLLDDIAAEETLQLQRLIHLLFENLSSLLDSVVVINQSGKLQESPTQTLDDLIPSLRKLRKLADLLDMPLKSVTEAWEAGELVNCGFTQTEVEDFIRAIFADSPLRKECLRRIESICY